jgi:hypothetical protein
VYCLYTCFIYYLIFLVVCGLHVDGNACTSYRSEAHYSFIPIRRLNLIRGINDVATILVTIESFIVVKNTKDEEYYNDNITGSCTLIWWRPAWTTQGTLKSVQKSGLTFNNG